MGKVRKWDSAVGLGMAVVFLTSQASGEEPIRLEERFSTGYQYHVSCRVELSGGLTLPPEKGQSVGKPLTIKGESAIDYDERILTLGTKGEVDKTARIYRRIDFQRMIGDQPQQSSIRAEVRRLVVLRLKNVEVPFSPDGPLTWGEIDLVRTDVFTPALVGLLPVAPVRTGDRWVAANTAIQELTDMERINEGQVECRLEQVGVVEKRRQARVALTGTVHGINEDGPNRQQLEGYFYFDLESHHLSYLSIKGVSILLDKDGKEMGKIEGRFVLTRQAPQASKDLSDTALKGVTLEPNDDNTMLLYDNFDLGLRFLYPRRWKVMSVQGRQVAVEANGSGLLLTREPLLSVPTGAQFLGESKNWLEQQKGKIGRVEAPQRMQTKQGEEEHFSLHVDLQGQSVVMDYFVTRQALGGATLAARLLPKDLAGLRKDVARIAASIQITRTLTEEKGNRRQK
jgi:hypothetical protein